MATLTGESKRKNLGLLIAVGIVLALALIAVVGFVFLSNSAAGDVLTYNLSEPLGQAKAVKFDIDNGDGNLTVDSLASGDQALASGTLQYMENQGLPGRSLSTENGQTTLALKAGDSGQPWSGLPWETCNGATEWKLYLNPDVSSEVTAHSDGGNVILNLASMAVTRLMADTGGGNMEVILPDHITSLNVSAKAGAGNVNVHLPDGIAARIHASSGLGKVVVDPQFSQIDEHTYQSPDYDTALNKIEIAAESGAGNVSVTIK
ncbi:MAG: cell wall-active antibiotics response protein [Chloroflexi bacterium]|nr:cell wall-active antibiotics response protein [Chloroflexota bacterium]